MADQELREALNDCMDRMAAGQSVNDCLRHYPHYAAALRPLLEVGSLVGRAQANPVEVASAQTRVRAQVSAHLRERPARRSYSHLVALAASLLIAFAALFGAAENSLPGDSLYSVKRFTENARSALIGQEFAGRRLDEIRALEALKRPADVEFSGQVEQIEATSWRVAGLAMQVAPGTAGAAPVVVGDTIRAAARTTRQGDLVASQITLLNKVVVPLVSTATPTPTFTPTPSPTSTPNPASTTCAPTLPDGWVSYVVQSGDTVSGLALITGTSAEELIAVNCLPETRMIVVGQTLFLPMLPPSTPTQPLPTPALTSDGSSGQPPVQPLATDDHHNGSGDSSSGQPSENDD